MDKQSVFQMMEPITEYYEFNDTEYYGLIKTTGKINRRFMAMKTYLATIGGYDDLTHMRIEKVNPTIISKDEALLKFIKCKEFENMKVGEVISLFESAEDNSTIIVDGSLL